MKPVLLVMLLLLAASAQGTTVFFGDTVITGGATTSAGLVSQYNTVAVTTTIRLDSLQVYTKATNTNTHCRLLVYEVEGTDTSLIDWTDSILVTADNTWRWMRGTTFNRVTLQAGSTYILGFVGQGQAVGQIYVSVREVVGPKWLQKLNTWPNYPDPLTGVTVNNDRSMAIGAHGTIPWSDKDGTWVKGWRIRERIR